MKGRRKSESNAPADTETSGRRTFASPAAFFTLGIVTGLRAEASGSGACVRPAFGLQCLSKSRTALPRPCMPTSPPVPTSRILIDDDDARNCELLDAYLAPEGYEIDTVYNGQQTLDRVAQQ